MGNSYHELQQTTYNATVTHIKQITDHLAIHYYLPDEPMPKPEPGQYISMGLFNFENPTIALSEPKLIRRAYSLSYSFDNERSECLEVYLAKVPNGELTPKLFNLQVGDRLYITPKVFGHYTLPELSGNETLIFTSTGTGLAPHLSMLKASLNRCKRILLIDCVRYKADLGYYDLLKDIEKKHSHLSYIPIATRDDKDKRYIQDIFQNDILENEYDVSIDKQTTHVFACGNPKMIGIPKKDRESGVYLFPEETGLVEILIRKYGLEIHKTKLPGQIHFEKYW